MAKRITSLLLILLTCLPLWAQQDNTPPTFSGGMGTEESPYLITSAEDLQALAKAVNKGDNYENKYFRLTESLNITDNWTPIGTDKDHFSGTFNGNGKTLTLPQYLFKSVSNGKILNLTISVTYEASETSCILVYEAHNTIIENITTNGMLTVSGNKSNIDLGGIAYWIDSGTSISNCINNADLSATDIVGGIAVYVDSKVDEKPVIIKNCINNGNITSSPTGWTNNTGGIVGNMFGGIISDCTNTGTITGTNQGTGGIVGNAFYYDFTEEEPVRKGYDIILLNNINKGEINGTAIAVGGIVGLADSNWNNIEVINCLNTGNVTGSALCCGIVGIAQTIRGGNEDNPGNKNNEDHIKIINCGSTGTVSVQGEDGAPMASIAVVDGSGKEYMEDCVYIEQKGVLSVLTGKTDETDIEEPVKATDKDNMIEVLNIGALNFNKENPDYIYKASGWTFDESGNIIQGLLPPDVSDWGKDEIDYNGDIVITFNHGENNNYTIQYSTDNKIWGDVTGNVLTISEVKSETTVYVRTTTNDLYSTILQQTYTVKSEPPVVITYHDLHITESEGAKLVSRHGKHRTTDGGSFTLSLVKEPGYETCKPEVFVKRGRFREWRKAKFDEVSGYYQIHSVYTDIYVKVSGDGIWPVSNEEVEAREAKVYTQNGAIVVVTAEPLDVQVTSMSGAVSAMAKVSGHREFHNLAAGVYIVRVGDKAVKVRL